MYKAYDTYKTANIFLVVQWALDIIKKLLYPRLITLAKRYLRFYRCHGPYIFDKISNVFIFNYYYY